MTGIQQEGNRENRGETAGHCEQKGDQDSEGLRRQCRSLQAQTSRGGEEISHGDAEFTEGKGGMSRKDATKKCDRELPMPKLLQHLTAC